MDCVRVRLRTGHPGIPGAPESGVYQNIPYCTMLRSTVRVRESDLRAAASVLSCPVLLSARPGARSLRAALNKKRLRFAFRVSVSGSARAGT